MINLFNIFLNLLIAGVVFYILYVTVGKIPLPAPFPVVVQAVLAIAIAVYLLGILFGWTPVHPFLVG